MLHWLDAYDRGRGGLVMVVVSGGKFAPLASIHGGAFELRLAFCLAMRWRYPLLYWAVLLFWLLWGA